METLLDRARGNTLVLIDETRGIISAMETGILINWPPQELDRLKEIVAEHERLLQHSVKESDAIGDRIHACHLYDKQRRCH